MNLPDFRRYRDTHALECMLERRERHLLEADGAWQTACHYRAMLNSDGLTRREKELLTPHYDEAMREWAVAEMLVGCIERDWRYVEHMKRSEQ